MKNKILLFIAIAFLGANIMKAQTFQKGTAVGGLSFGIGNTFGYSGYSVTIPICVSFDYGVVDHLIGDKGAIGVGGELAYAGQSFNYAYGTIKVTNVIFGVRGTFHYPLVDKLDTYGGILLGYNVVSSSGTTYDGYNYGNSVSGSDPALGLFVGGRYYFTNNIAVFAELGYNIAYLNFGLAYKFK